jgi:hypothetical protein
VTFGWRPNKEWKYGQAGLITIVREPVSNPDGWRQCYGLHIGVQRKSWAWPWEERYIGYGCYQFGMGPLFLYVW